MNKDLDTIIKRLLRISQMILDEFEVMASLSYNNQEESSQFSDHLEDTKNYLNSEAVIINNLELAELEEIFKILPNYDDGSPAYERTHIYIDNVIEKLQQTETQDETLDEETAAYNFFEQYYSDLLADKETDDEDDFIQKYYLDTAEAEKYEIATIDYIAINTLKKMWDRINNTYADNKKDSKFKKRLLRNLKSFKYIILSLDPNLEKIGVNYRFNVERIPYSTKPKINTSRISYNQCITHLEKLYNTNRDGNDIDDINESLFNMMCLESFLEDLDQVKLARLASLCEEFEEHSTHQPFYGNIAKEKILKKIKN